MLSPYLLGLAEGSADSRSKTKQRKEDQATSLSRALLSLGSFSAQQRALCYILSSMQVQLCRDLVVGMFAQPKAVVGDQIHTTIISPEACAMPIFPAVPDTIQLIGRKEIAALWELLKLASFRASSNSSEEAVNSLSGLLQGQYPILLQPYK